MSLLNTVGTGAVLGSLTGAALANIAKKPDLILKGLITGVALGALAHFVGATTVIVVFAGLLFTLNVMVKVSKVVDASVQALSEGDISILAGQFLI